MPSGGAFEVLVKKEKLSLPPRESYQAEETCTTMLSMSPHGECLVDQHYDSFLWCC